MLLSGHLQAADTKILVLLRESFTLIFFLPVTLFPRGLGSFNIPVMQFVQILSPLRRKRHFPINTMYWVLHWTLTNVWSAPVLTVQWSCPCYIGHCQMSQVPLYLQSSGAAPVTLDTVKCLKCPCTYSPVELPVLHWTLSNVSSAPVLTVQWSCPCSYHRMAVAVSLVS